MCTHPEVVHEVPGHPDSGAVKDCNPVRDQRKTEAPKDTNGHDSAKVVDDSAKAEDAEPVEDGGGDESGIPACQGVAVVHEGFVVQRWNREAFLLVARHDECKEELEDHESDVESCRPGIGIRVLQAERILSSDTAGQS